MSIALLSVHVMMKTILFNKFSTPHWGFSSRRTIEEIQSEKKCVYTYRRLLQQKSILCLYAKPQYQGCPSSLYLQLDKERFFVGLQSLIPTTDLILVMISPAHTTTTHTHTQKNGKICHYSFPLSVLEKKGTFEKIIIHALPSSVS